MSLVPQNIQVTLVHSKMIYLSQLENKLNNCINIFDNYSDEIVSNKIKINNYNTEKNINNNSYFYEETNFPIPFNQISAEI